MLASFNFNKQKVIYTTTGEPVMPVRLYYKIYNESLLIKALKNLKCVKCEENKRFSIAYYKETKNFKLKVHYQDVPEDIYPVALANGYIKQDSIMHLDLLSLQRAVYMIDFLAKNIPSTILKITNFANYNKLTITNNKQELEEIRELATFM